MMITNPMPHQQAAIDKALPILEKTGIAAFYDFYMGLGKSFISLHLAHRLLCPIWVIVCPKTVVSGWQDEIKKHTVDVPYMTWDSVKAKSPKYQETFRELSKGEGREPALFLINIEAFQTENLILAAMLKQSAPIAGVILDEAIKIKSADTNRSKRLFSAFDAHRYKIGLSGRSITEGPLDVYSMYRYFGPKFWPFRSFWQFKSYYAILKDAYGAGGRTFKQVSGFQRLDDLRARVAPITVSMSVADSGIQLPEQIDAPLLFDLDPEETRVYSDLQKHMRTMLANGEMLTKTEKISLYSNFRMICGGWLDTKREIQPGKLPSKLRAMLEDLEDTGANAVICCDYRHEIQQVSDALIATDSGRVVVLSGLQSDKANDAAKRDFANGEARFLVSDVGMVARGLNLQKYCALMYDYSLTPSCDEYDQHRKRIHRIGQTETCVYKQCLARNTVDEKLYSLVQRKIELSNAFADGSLADIISLV